MFQYISCMIHAQVYNCMHGTCMHGTPDILFLTQKILSNCKVQLLLIPFQISVKSICSSSRSVVITWVSPRSSFAFTLRIQVYSQSKTCWWTDLLEMWRQKLPRKSHHRFDDELVSCNNKHSHPTISAQLAVELVKKTRRAKWGTPLIFSYMYLIVLIVFVVVLVFHC